MLEGCFTLLWISPVLEGVPNIPLIIIFPYVGGIFYITVNQSCAGGYAKYTLDYYVSLSWRDLSPYGGSVLCLRVCQIYP